MLPLYDYKAKFTGRDGLLKKGEIDDLTENYIVTKALKAFAQNGTIPKVFPEKCTVVKICPQTV